MRAAVDPTWYGQASFATVYDFAACAALASILAMLSIVVVTCMMLLSMGLFQAIFLGNARL